MIFAGVGRDGCDAGYVICAVWMAEPVWEKTDFYLWGATGFDLIAGGICCDAGSRVLCNQSGWLFGKRKTFIFQFGWTAELNRMRKDRFLSVELITSLPCRESE